MKIGPRWIVLVSSLNLIRFVKDISFWLGLKTLHHSPQKYHLSLMKIRPYHFACFAIKRFLSSRRLIVIPSSAASSGIELQKAEQKTFADNWEEIIKNRVSRASRKQCKCFHQIQIPRKLILSNLSNHCCLIWGAGWWHNLPSSKRVKILGKPILIPILVLITLHPPHTHTHTLFRDEMLKSSLK